MKYKKIYEVNRAGRKPVSIWVNADPYRSFDEVIIGQSIKADNILTRRFDYPISICQSNRDLNDALKRYQLTTVANRNKKVKEALSEFASFRRNK